MAKQPSNKRNTPAQSNVSSAAQPAPAAKAQKAVTWLPYAIVFVFACLVYGNTLFNRFAIDDVIVYTDNQFTKRGTAGIGDHFTHDMFEGFFGERGAKLVSGGRYRPLSMATFSVEYEITRMMRGDKRDVIDDKNVIIGDQDPYLNPMLGHAVNILLFALTCVLLYHLLIQLIPAHITFNTPIGGLGAGIALLATLLYAAHPLHTEAVSNIKGRDEVMCMLFAVLSIIASVVYVRTDNPVHLIWGVLVYFLSLLSKENAVTFFALIPLTFFFFTKAKPKQYAFTVAAYLIPFAIFLVLRSKYTQAGLTQESPEILNNPFLGTTFGQRYGTTILTFLYYFKLLVFPHPLTHDYYFNQIPLVGFDDARVLLSILVTGALVVFALMKMKEKNIAAYGILFFFITFSVASNVLFTVGVLMNERFIYMSSLGFCILLAYLLVTYIKDKRILASVAGVILLLYSVKTYSRNEDWLDSFTLFRKDQHISYNSAKIQTSVGGDLTKAADSDIPALRDSGMIKKFFRDLNPYMDETTLNNINMLPDTTLRFMLLDSSIAHLNEATRIYANHSNAWLLLGNAVYKRYKDVNRKIPVKYGEQNLMLNTIEIYESAGKFRVGGYYDAYFNLGVVYNEINRADSARVNLLRALQMKPENMECRFLLAQAHAKLNNPDSVNYWLQRGAEVKKPDAADYYLLGTAFGKVAGNMPLAISYLQKAVEMNPKAELYLEDLGVAYGISGNFDAAIATAQKLIELNPKYPAAYMNLSVSYRNKGNVALADQYMAKYRELTNSR